LFGGVAIAGFVVGGIEHNPSFNHALGRCLSGGGLNVYSG
jgi:hypothetical protein